MSGLSLELTPYAVICTENILGGPGCGKQYLTEEEYRRQLARPHKPWQCPSCGEQAEWDDANYERFYP